MSGFCKAQVEQWFLVWGLFNKQAVCIAIANIFGLGRFHKQI